METFLMLNGREISATVDEAEEVILSVAASRCSREELLAWVQAHVGHVGTRGGS